MACVYSAEKGECKMSINRALSRSTGDRFQIYLRWLPIVLASLTLFVQAANANGVTAIVGGTVVDLEGKAPPTSTVYYAK